MPNDPQWGKKNNEGPPDLEEMFRKAQQKIAALLGFRPRGSGTAGAPPARGGNYGAAMGGGVALVVMLIVAVWLASGFYIVDEGKRGVVLRLGKYLETTMPGPRWHIPYPVEGVEIVDVARVRTVEVGYRGNTKNKQPQEALDAHRRREHRRRAVRGAVDDQEPRGLPLQQQRTRTTTCCRRPRPRSARSWARARWTSCSPPAAARSPRR